MSQSRKGAQGSTQESGRSISHDQNLKNLIVDYPQQAVAFFAAREATRVDRRVKIRPLRQEMQKEKLRHRFRALDVPLLLEWSNGEREALMFVIEPEAQARKFDIYRLAHYCLDLSKLYVLTKVAGGNTSNTSIFTPTWMRGSVGFLSSAIRRRVSKW